MMPTLLSDSLCSLQQGETRFAFTMDVFILNSEIIDVRFVNSVIRVAHNYVYDEPSLMKSSIYGDLKILTREILKTKQHNYIHSAKTSHDVVEFWMIFMNHYCSLVMNRYNRESKNIPSVGIYRSVKILQNEDISNKPETLDEETQKFIRIWKNTSGQYVIGTPDGGHDTIGVQSYIHITSPIRRLVDLLNMIMIQSSLRLVTLTKDAQMFLENWLSKIELINTTMRSIRKVQMDCSLLELCSRNPDICNRNYRGCIFDKLEHHSGLYQYIVYISELKIVSRITCREDMKEYSNAMFAIYLFQDQDKLRQRIRVHFVES
jgi:exoribonuclease R